MDTIRSRQNPQVKALRRAVADNGRVRENVFVAEGWHLLEELARNSPQHASPPDQAPNRPPNQAADREPNRVPDRQPNRVPHMCEAYVGSETTSHNRPFELQQLFVREDALPRWRAFAEEYSLPGDRAAVLSPDAFDSAMDTPTPQGIAAFVQRHEQDIDAALSGSAPLAVVLSGVQDPGNVGTILRSARAFGAAAAFILPGSANCFGTKSLRASAGAAFALPVFFRGWEEVSALLAAHGCRLAATVPRDGLAPAEIAWNQGVALLLGSEGAGLDADMLAQAEIRVTIAMPGGAESLNVATAAGILLYEASCCKEGPRSRAAR